MNPPAVYGLRVSSVIFGLMAASHLVRIIIDAGLQIGSVVIGRLWSAIAVFVFTTLCSWLWMLASTAAKEKADAPPVKPAA